MAQELQSFRHDVSKLFSVSRCGVHFLARLENRAFHDLNNLMFNILYRLSNISF